MSTSSKATAAEAAKKEAATMRQFAEAAKVDNTTSAKKGVGKEAQFEAAKEEAKSVTFSGIAERAVISLCVKHSNILEAVFESIFEAVKNSGLIMSNLEAKTAAKEAANIALSKVDKLESITTLLNCVKKADAKAARKAARKAAKESSKEEKQQRKAAAKAEARMTKEAFIEAKKAVLLAAGISEEQAAAAAEALYNSTIVKA